MIPTDTRPPDKEKPAPDYAPKGGPFFSHQDTERSVSDRIVRLTFLKNQQRENIEFLANQGGEKESIQAVRLIDCGTFLKFHDYFQICVNRLVGANFCKQHFYCPLCAGRRARVSVAAYKEKIEWIMDHKSRPLYAHLITHTVKNGSCLSERFRHLNATLAKLLKRRHLAAKYPNSTFSDSVAGVTSIEVKRGAGLNLWHVHAHTFVLSPQRTFNWQACKDEWFHLSGDSQVVNFAACAQDVPVSSHLREVLKYVAKFGDLSPADRHHVASVLRGRSLVRPWGALRGLRIDAKLLDEPLQGQPYMETLWHWLGACYTVSNPRLCEAAAAGGPRDAQASSPNGRISA